MISNQQTVGNLNQNLLKKDMTAFEWIFSTAYYSTAFYILSFTLISHLLLYYFVKNFGKKVVLPIVNTLATTKWRAFGRDFANSKSLLSLVHLKAVETVVVNVNAHKPIPINLTDTRFSEFENAVYSRYEFHADSYLDKLMKYTEKLDGVFRALEEFKVVSDEIGDCNVPVSASSFLSLKTIVPARGGGGGTMVTRDNRDTFPTEIPFHRLSPVTIGANDKVGINVLSTIRSLNNTHSTNADIGSAVIADGFAPCAAAINVDEDEGDDDSDIDRVASSDSMPSLVDIENDSSETGDVNNSFCQCFNCGQFNHRAAQCPQRGCFKCDELGHLTRHCPSATPLAIRLTCNTGDEEIEVKIYQNEVPCPLTSFFSPDDSPGKGSLCGVDCEGIRDQLMRDRVTSLIVKKMGVTKNFNVTEQLLLGEGDGTGEKVLWDEVICGREVEVLDPRKI